MKRRSDEEISAPLYEYDAAVRSQYGCFAGVDEAGRGPLCGPVCVAACILDPANDHAAANVMIQKSLKMAAPPGIKTVIKSIDDAIKTLNDPRCEPLKVLVLVNSPEDALKMAKQVKGIPFINVGNYGRVAPKKEGKERKRFDNNLYCDTDEEATFRELMATGLECICQTTPEEIAIPLKKLIQ